MDTKSKAYKKHLEKKYLPGRDLFLHYIIYPKYMQSFNKNKIYDLGCGMGEFLIFCRKKNIDAFGIDSNPSFVTFCKNKELNVQEGNIINLYNIKIDNAICDNVLEHLNLNQIDSFFKNIKEIIQPKGILLIIVPCEKGYQCDPTHQTFIDESIIFEFCQKYQLIINKQYYHPINRKFIGKYFYLNMSIFEIFVPE